VPAAPSQKQKRRRKRKRRRKKEEEKRRRRKKKKRKEKKRKKKKKIERVGESNTGHDPIARIALSFLPLHHHCAMRFFVVNHDEFGVYILLFLSERNRRTQ
jgi:chemotaxis response regulator CheB